MAISFLRVVKEPFPLPSKRYRFPDVPRAIRSALPSPGPVAGGFAVLFLLVLVVMLLRGVRGMDAWRRSSLFPFGWANWFQASANAS